MHQSPQKQKGAIRCGSCRDRQAHCHCCPVKLRTIVVFFLAVTFLCAKSQENDSLRLYKKIKNLAVRSRLTKMAYEAVFRDPESFMEVDQASDATPVLMNPYQKYSGCYISALEISVLDPFGFSLTDSVLKRPDRFQSIGNRLHLTTRKFIIANRLLFHVGEKADPVKISESERLLRSAVFINDARIIVMPKVKTDSVKILVLVQDKWPVSIPAEITDVNVNAQFRNNNLFGSGQQFEQYGKIFRDRSYLFRAYYNVSNISNTFISSQIGYATTPDETGIYCQFDKPFYSFLASWAGGLNLNHSWRRFTYFDTLQKRHSTVPLNRGGVDLWLGKSLKISEQEGVFNQASSLLIGARFLDQLYFNRPNQNLDTTNSFLNSSALIGNIAVAVQHYYKDKFIYRFGATEDIPEGFLLQFTYGLLLPEKNKSRFYNGLELARARHFKFGYLSAGFSYGIFYNTGVPNDVTSNYNVQYFSEVIKKKKILFRQFIRLNFIHGENKMERQTITLRPEDLYGFQNGSLTGNSRLVFNSETVCYLPYQVIGFRFAPVLMVGLGMIGDQQSRLWSSRLYQGYSLGVLLRNENLLTSTFQFSFGFYPFLPDHKGPVVVYNPVTSFTLRMRGFSVGRPEFIPY